MDHPRDHDPQLPPLPDESGPSPFPAGHVDAWEALAVDYLDGTLPPETLGTVEAHLRDCTPCRVALEAQRLALTIAAAIPQIEPPEDLRARVLSGAAPRPPKAARSYWERFRALTRPGALVPAAAIVVLLLVVGAAAVRLLPGGGGTDSALKSGEAPATTAAAGLRSADQTTAANAQPEGQVGPDSSEYGAEPEGVGGEAGTTLERSQMEAAGDESSVPETTTTVAGALAEMPIVPVWVSAPGQQPEGWAAVVEEVTDLSPLPSASVQTGPVFAALVEHAQIDLLVAALRANGLDVATPGDSGEGVSTTTTGPDPTGLLPPLDTLPVLKRSSDGDYSLESVPSGSAEVTRYVVVILTGATAR